MKSVFQMIDIGEKAVTHRIAIAEGNIQLSAAVRQAIEEKRVPKGDVLTLAEVAGINAAKRTADILPLCHPLTLEAVQIASEIDAINNLVRISCRVSTHGRTGVEMEALAGVTAALLCIYDLTKGLDRGAIIGEIRLRHKEGGKSGVWRDDGVNKEAGTGQPQPEQKALCGLLAAVLTVSDSCAVDESRDLSGKIIADFLREQRAEVVEAQIVPDEIKQIRAAVERFALQEKTELVLVTGGTGLGPRDVTPEALAPLWSKTLPGFGEQFRIFGTKNDARAWLSRAEAGMVGNAIVILLPGSPSGVRDGLQVIKANLPHMLAMARGGKH